MTTYLRRVSVRRPALMILLVMIGAVVGCHEDENTRVAKVATQAADRQPMQNEEMARLNLEVAEGTKRLVEDGGVAAQDRKISAVWQTLLSSGPKDDRLLSLRPLLAGRGNACRDAWASQPQSHRARMSEPSYATIDWIFPSCHVFWGPPTRYPPREADTRRLCSQFSW